MSSIMRWRSGEIGFVIGELLSLDCTKRAILADRRPLTDAVRYVHEVHPGHHLEQLADDMRWSSNPTRRHGEVAGVGLGISDELGNGLGRNRWVHHHDVGTSDDARDRRDVADQIE